MTTTEDWWQQVILAASENFADNRELWWHHKTLMAAGDFDGNSGLRRQQLLAMYSLIPKMFGTFTATGSFDGIIRF